MSTRRRAAAICAGSVAMSSISAAGEVLFQALEPTAAVIACAVPGLPAGADHPQSVGLPVAGRKRLVPGLRREEVAALAGLSVDYYIRLERGALTSASDSVLQAIARELRLDAAEQAHLIDLVRAGMPSAASRSRRARVDPPAVADGP